MKIGIVCYPTFGGSGVVATELGKALADRGHQVHFVTYNQPARLDLFSENLFYHEVSVSNYPLFDFPPYELALASRLVDVVRHEQLDVLHVHYAIPHASAAFMAKQILMTYGIYIPVVTTLHGTDITLVGKDRTFKPVVTFSINQSDGVTAVSQNLKEDTYKFFDIKKDILVIPNFIDLSRFSLKPKDHFKKAIAPSGEKILVHTSNFRKVKRTEDVVKIFAKVIKKIPSKLLMVGDGPERSMCEQLCRDLGVTDNVRFLGKQDAVEEILSVSDLFLMPSQSESFGLAALEAMACKVPVISSNAGGLPELNIDGVTGFLKEPGDVEGMAEKAIFILEDEERLAKFKENALAHAKEFELSTILPKYENFYLEVIEQNKAKLFNQQL
ncbi:MULTISPECIES: N-acetyl-alpha-D-glucosaminyl L-malate synthase BshA [Mucilaginibacter]|jgi:N-acetyl-alpha-D-glucosaminyl L-malate synthase BshA|uniref:N-acetyl-alpha-D-glucosaminyl L-malate synthase BshA n=2 Tax=Mucilaginibacter TaxID=423349 RepID=A0AAE6ML86_9SPHI|nr:MULTISPECIES: N-acetyl-alpha-D-glucosaminyl L-malate synthase BshA [Mucilaginibacter]QEM07521.1 N-acetyl-alpha-D-glucosaminyl L-malate synthase BshA [Mucilaginibacter rubeus]QEM19975.1 N-acetyl-alpha-D-glucosaminyl L-malate synthase BshA [Mucilaginibacter gossypii]QTE35008.1 N-acetyl-alpha-D-glucosaminyl L-malate synthase BshA [Mucilaginibacter gossypii]QTE43317.1 N-acetyl-alpha-D-glucosaminyl L-malate synthase BshA [Mucilaginibacter rubeus]QTE49917.1 N-acetyl-alpha-D-glucosaminyl L-malate 